MVTAYRFCISPFLLPHCRFYPSCSLYAIEALKVHGAKKGGALIIKRLLRCHPFGSSASKVGKTWGYDPVTTNIDNDS